MRGQLLTLTCLHTKTHGLDRTIDYAFYHHVIVRSRPFFMKSTMACAFTSRGEKKKKKWHTFIKNQHGEKHVFLAISEGCTNTRRSLKMALYKADFLKCKGIQPSPLQMNYDLKL